MTRTALKSSALVTRERVSFNKPYKVTGFCIMPGHEDRKAEYNGTQCPSCYQTVMKAAKEGRADLAKLARKGMIVLPLPTIEEFWLL